MLVAFPLLLNWLPLRMAQFVWGLLIFFAIRVLLRIISLILDAIPFV